MQCGLTERRNPYPCWAVLSENVRNVTLKHADSSQRRRQSFPSGVCAVGDVLGALYPTHTMAVGGLFSKTFRNLVVQFIHLNAFCAVEDDPLSSCSIKV